MAKQDHSENSEKPKLKWSNVLYSQLRVADPVPEGAPAPRVTKAEKKIRIGVVRDWILAGCTSDHIVQLSAETWGIKERQARKYIADANLLIDAYVVDDTANAIKIAVQEREMIKRKAVASGELYIALDAMKDTAKMLGLYKPDEMTLKVSPELAMLMRMMNIDPDQVLIALQKQLEAKAAAHGIRH